MNSSSVEGEFTPFSTETLVSVEEAESVQEEVAESFYSPHPP